MLHKVKKWYLPLLITLLLFLIPGMVFADTIPELQEYCNTGGDGDSNAIYGSNWHAMQFTCDNMSHSITKVRVPIKRVGTDVGTVTLSIREADSGLPIGTDLASATIDGDDLDTSYSWWEFDVDETLIAGQEQYAIVMRVLSGDSSNYIMWQKDTGGSLANAVGSNSTTAGVAWTSGTPLDFLFEVYGNDSLTIESANVFSDYKEDGDLLFTVNYKNVFKPYYALHDPADYFNLVVLDTDESTILASSPIHAWGNKPQGVYLNADSAASITLGEGLYIGILYSTTNVTYELEAEDWKGSDLSYLDKWVRLTAGNMEEYYDVTLLTYVSGKGEVLNDDGSALFTEGISGLMNYRPNLFKTVVGTSTADIDIPEDVFSETKNWEVSLGDDLVDLAEEGGDLVDLDGKGTVQIVIAIVFSLFAIFMLASGHFMFAFVGAIPVALIGMELGIIDAVYVGLIAAIFVLVFVWNIWWSRV